MTNLLSPLDAAKVMGFVLFAHGTVHFLAPSPTAERYGVPNNDFGQYDQPIRRIGCALLFTSAIVWTLLFQEDGDRHQAYALATSVWVVEMLKSILNKETALVGNMVCFLLNVLLLYGFLNESWAPLSSKVGVSSLLFFGLGLTFVPKTFCLKIYGGDAKHFDEKHEMHMAFVVRACGIALLQCGALVALLESGLEPVRAFGFSCLVDVLGLLSVFGNLHGISFELSFRHIAMACGASLLTFLMLQEQVKSADSPSDSD